MDNRLLFAATLQKCFDLGDTTLSQAIKREHRRREQNRLGFGIGRAVLTNPSEQGYSFIPGRHVRIPMGVKCEPAFNLPQGGYWIVGDWCSITDEVRSWRDAYGFWVSDDEVTVIK